MKHIIHAIWTSPNISSTELGKSLNLFYERLPTRQDGHRHIYSSKLEEIFERAEMDERIEWVVVHKQGQIYNSQNLILEEINKHISTLDPNTLVSGQLIDRPGFYCGIHEQFFIVNLKTYKKLGRPFFGDYQENILELHNYSAGPSLHDNYTPSYLTPKEGVAQYKTWTCGWNFVNVSMKSGLTITNIPQGIRSRKVFLYPDEETEQLLQNFEALYQIKPTSNISQNSALLHLIAKKLRLEPSKSVSGYSERKTSVFVFNTELIVENPGWIDKKPGELSMFMGAAAGFIDVGNLKRFGFSDQTRLVYYDINPDSVYFKKYMLENFSGKLAELPEFLTQFINDHPHILIADNSWERGLRELNREFGSDDEFYNIWKRMQGLEKEFIELNLLQNYKKLAKVARSAKGRVFFSISDIFMGMNELTYGVFNLNQIFRELLHEFSANSNVIIQGKDCEDQFFIGYATELYEQYANSR